MQPIKSFIGDAERDFALTPAMIRELERITGAGIGRLMQRIVAREFHFSDLTETIRLALIGGGTAPSEAQALVNTYVADRPLSEVYPLALAIMERLFFGDEPQKEETDAAE